MLIDADIWRLLVGALYVLHVTNARFSFYYFSIGYILNITREIDNFFPGLFKYYNIRVYDIEQSDLLKYWGKTYRFINEARWVPYVDHASSIYKVSWVQSPRENTDGSRMELSTVPYRECRWYLDGNLHLLLFYWQWWYLSSFYRISVSFFNLNNSLCRGFIFLCPIFNFRYIYAQKRKHLASLVKVCVKKHLIISIVPAELMCVWGQSDWLCVGFFFMVVNFWEVVTDRLKSLAIAIANDCVLGGF